MLQALQATVTFAESPISPPQIGLDVCRLGRGELHRIVTAPLVNPSFSLLCCSVGTLAGSTVGIHRRVNQSISQTAKVVAKAFLWQNAIYRESWLARPRRRSSPVTESHAP